MRRASKRVGTGMAMAVAVGVGAVSLATGNPTAVPPAAADLELKAFDTCEALRSWYVTSTLPQVTAWGLGYGHVIPLATRDVTAQRSAAEGVTDADAVGNGATGTNVQEQGVDEPDVAKTNGEIVVTLRHGDLIVYDSTGAEPVEVGRLDLPRKQQPEELLLVGDRVILLGSVYGIGPGTPLADRSFGYPSQSRTVVTTVDLADTSAPRLVRTRTVHGELVSAREHDGTVRVVTSSRPDFDFVVPNPPKRTAREAKARNRQIVRNAPLQRWLPQTRVDRGRWQPLLSCSDVRRPQDPAGLGTISVLTLNPDDDTLTASGLAADGEMVYSSAERMYVATISDGWTEWTVDRRAESGTSAPTSTDVHAFDVSGDDTAYVASGSVPGIVPDRWAFSEHEGRLRVASTVGQRWSPRETRVTVLDERGTRLEPVGSVGGMGKRERIYAVRWFGDVAVVVTFRQVDPLYTVDLSDPTDPVVRGKLKIPGFSEYLHPVGGGILLGAGQQATKTGRIRGAQLSTFDLGNLTAPRRTDTTTFGRHRTSAVEYDSRAFTYLPEHRLAIVPTNGSGGSSFEVVHVGTDASLKQVASIAMPGWSADRARALPLDDGRVALVANGRIIRLAAPVRW